MLAALSLDFDDGRSAADVEAAVSRIEHEIKAAFPEVTRVFVISAAKLSFGGDIAQYTTRTRASRPLHRICGQAVAAAPVFFS